MNPTPKILASLLVVAPLGSSLCAHAQEYAFGKTRSPTDVSALSTSGSSGALNVPDARTLPDGTMVLGLNNTFDPQFYRYARSRNYQFGIGLFRHVELSGRLADYPVNRGGDLGVRDLSANVKLSLPKLLRGQPDIAIGMNDLGGGAAFFESKYLVVSDTFGPLRLNAGAAKGKPYLGRGFGSAELALGRSGFALLAERNNHASHAGLRYGSMPIGALGNAQLIVTLQRSFGAHAPDGRKFDRSSAGLNLSIPFGENARAPVRVDPDAEPLWTPPAGYRAPVAGAAPAAAAPGAQATQAAPVAAALAASVVEPALESVRAKLLDAGLERVRVGLRGGELVIEYENHRYNQNEVDAIGVALAAGATLAPDGVTSLSVVTKKAGLGLYRTGVDRAIYRQFLRDGEIYEAKSALTLQYRPDDGGAVQWLDQSEGPRGYSRVRIDPQLVTFVGTELGVFDYSLAANVQAFVPVWKGAELMTSYIKTVAESDTVAHGFFSYAQQRNGLKSATLSQAFWLTDRVANVTSAGKILYDDVALQNETTWFMPYNDDQVRVLYSRVRHVDGLHTRVYETGGASYLWNYQPLNASVELGYNRYVGQDSGPTLKLNKWFGDIQTQVSLRRSEFETRVGFGIGFPLTPRQGMRPGLTHVEGASSFGYKLETRLAKSGQCNCITAGVVEEMPMIYSAKGNLFNLARIGRGYLVSQLPRMREAGLIFSRIAP